VEDHGIVCCTGYVERSLATATKENYAHHTKKRLAFSPLSEQIAALAHALWQERGCPEGSSEEDWFKAEHQLAEQLQRQTL